MEPERTPTAMMLDARRALPGSVFETEVCVIGTGPAGATVAAELADRGVGVIVLEGGGTGRDRAAADSYRGIQGDGAHDPLDAVRRKRLGGSSDVWGGRCAPLDDQDLAAREWVPESGWPIGPDELRRFHARAQAHLDAGSADFSARSSGLPDALADLADTDVLRWDDLWRWSPPTTFAPRMRTLAESGRLRLFVHATVARLDRDPAGAATGPVREAVVVSRPGVEFRVRAREFVLAAGGLESTRILLASDGYGGSGLGAGLGNEHDQVGRHYMTHPVGEVGRLRLTDAGRAFGLGYLTTTDGVYARRMLSLTPRVQAEHRLRNLKAALWFADPRDPGHHDALLSTFALTYWGLGKARTGFKSAGTHAGYAGTTGILRHVRNIATGLPRVARFTGGWARPRLTGARHLPSFMPLDGDHCRLRFDAEQAPDPRNRVTLDRERDVLGQRRLRVDYTVSDADRQSIATSLTLIGKEVERTGLATVDLSDVGTVTDMPMTDGTHQMGLLRMSATARSGVVDTDCRVHGTPNVRVVSSAVFPTSGAVGPTMVLVALACRTADALAAS